MIKANWQVALMAPTEILAKQHFDLAKKIFAGTNVSIELLSGKSENKIKKLFKKKLFDGQINF